MKRIYRLAFISGAIILSSLQEALAAPPPPGGGGTPPCWPPPCIPVDKGSVFLIIAGLGLGAWKLYTAFFRKKTA